MTSAIPPLNRRVQPWHALNGLALGVLGPFSLSLLMCGPGANVEPGDASSAGSSDAAVEAKESDSSPDLPDATASDTGPFHDAALSDGAPKDATVPEGAGGDGASAAEGGGDSVAPDAGAAALGIDPPMGWSTWSFVRQGPTQAVIEAQAKALHDSGLSDHGYAYVNIDDFYYLNPSSHVDANGRWVVDSSKFPNGMAAVATYVHGLGLKFGM